MCNMYQQKKWGQSTVSPQVLFHHKLKWISLLSSEYDPIFGLKYIFGHLPHGYHILSQQLLMPQE